MKEVGAIIEGSHGISQSDEKAYLCNCALCAQRMVSAGNGGGDHPDLRALRLDRELMRDFLHKALK